MALTKVTGAVIETSSNLQTHNLHSTGIITATEFHGDGSNLTGVSGFATALSSDSASPLNTVFVTPKTLEVTAGIHTVNSNATSGNIAFIRQVDVHVAAGATFHIGSGTTLRTNVLNLF